MNQFSTGENSISGCSVHLFNAANEIPHDRVEAWFLVFQMKRERTACSYASWICFTPRTRSYKRIASRFLAGNREGMA